MVHIIECGLQNATQSVRKAATSAIGAEAAQLKLRLFDPLGPERVTEQWRQLAITPAQKTRYDGVYGLAKWLREHNEERAQGMVNGGWNLSFVSDGQLHAVVIGRMRANSVRVTRVFGAPAAHPLKGQVLSYAHLAVSQLATAAGLEGIIYDAPFSPGSIQQVERGAIPICHEGRQNMWAKRDVYVRTAPHSAVSRPFSVPPRIIHRDNAPVFRKLFGQNFAGKYT
jgi:hypothetical protein